MQTWLPGPSMQVLVDAARPEAGVLALLVHSDDFPQGVFADPWPVMCALCEQDCGKRPRQWGHQLYVAMMTALEDGEWPGARDWEVEDQFTDWYETRLRKLVDAHKEWRTRPASAANLGAVPLRRCREPWCCGSCRRPAAIRSSPAATS
ncbi:hypothetical protein ABZ442_20320 [Streptomyces triculaminicus]|uniref:hypothetical protein n=1 Tax=Streptomyces triculaminicus TaxID=2816232 RepID=UPI0033F27543